METSEINANKKIKMLPSIVEINPVETLKTIMNKVGFNPSYEITELPNHAANSCMKFMSQLIFQGISVQAFGKSKKESKQAAAVAMLQKLGKYPTAETSLQAPEITTSQKLANCPVTESSVKESSLDSIEITESSLQALNVFCRNEGIAFAKFQELGTVGPPHSRMFLYQCTLGSISTEGQANTKKLAKQYAAKLMLEKVIQNPDVFKTVKVNFGSTESNSQDLFKNIITNKPKLNNNGKESNSQDLLLKVIMNSSNQNKYEGVNLSESSTTVGSNKKIHQKLLQSLTDNFADPGKQLKMLLALREKCKVNFSDDNMSKFKNEFQLFLDKAKIDFHHMMVQTTQPFTAMLVLQLNTDPEILKISLGSTIAEAEFRAIGKVLATFDSLL